MRMLLMTSVAMLGLATGAAFAQTSTTQSPPSPSGSSQQPQPSNALPSGAATSVQSTPGSTVGGTGSGTTAGSASTPHPMSSMHVRHPMMHRHPAATNASTSATGDQSAPPTSAYRGGVGSPLSTRATDLTPSQGERMGNRLPSPGAAENDPHDLLVAAQRNLNQGKTGAAQQALEMAETRVLTRTTLPSDANQPDQGTMVQNISQARRALGSRDVNGAKQAIAAALQQQVPPPGPAVTTIPGGSAPGQSF